MPRKQNGWGTSKSFAFKGAGRVDRGKGVGAFGTYPGDRRYGTSVHRTVIEHWNLDSNWVKWRKGYEIYSRKAYAPLKVADLDSSDPDPFVIASLKSVLYQGTEYEIPTTFTAYEFPTSATDSNTHYVAKRTPEEKLLGVITDVQNDPLLYSDNKAKKEIRVQGAPDSTSGRLLLKMIGERLTDGAPNEDRTEATLKNILTEDNLPALYKGKTAPGSVIRNYRDPDLLQPTMVRVRVPVDRIIYPDNPDQFRRNQGIHENKLTKSSEPIDVLADPNQLIGKLLYIKDFYVEKPLTEVEKCEWSEDTEYMTTEIEDSTYDQIVYAIDPSASNLPPSMYDIGDLPKIFQGFDASHSISGTYVYKKSDYQKYFGRQYLSSDTVKELVQDISYVVLPFVIRWASVYEGSLFITSEPFISEVTLTPELTEKTQLVFGDKSFCKFTTTDTEWINLNTDVDPWMDEVFTSGKSLRPAETYTCGCPSHSHAILTMPQAQEPIKERKVNRQLRYPLPSAMGQNVYEGTGLSQVAGQVSSWDSPEHKFGLKLCKHSIAAMFGDKIRVQEPSEYPTAEAREEFNEKLADQIENTKDNFIASYKRGGISLKEIIFALAQGLNLDSVETAYVILRSS